MSSQIVQNLRRFPLLSYVNEVQTKGRQAIDSDTRAQAAALFDFADGMKVFETSLAADERAVINLIQDVLFTEKFLLSSPKPRYVAYTNLRLLNRFLLDDIPASLKNKWEVAKRALALMIRDWHERERDTLSDYLSNKGDGTLVGLENQGPATDKISHIKERERSLSALSAFSAVVGLSDTRVIASEVHRYPTDWSYFAADPEKQVTHLSCMPRSRWHDEYMFLRTTQATECCFAGILTGLTALPPIIRKGEFSEASEVLKGTLYFSDFLTKLFAVFDTMPVAHFYNGFREATGEASAIQSVRFQNIEVLTRGLADPKRSALAHQKEVRFAFEWSPPLEATLAGMCEMAKKAGKPGEEFLEIAQILDRGLYKWRARHRGIARKYLPMNSVGTGNEGIPYLDANFATPRYSTASSNIHDESDMSQEDAPARVTLAFGLHGEGFTPVAVIKTAGINAAKIQTALTGVNTRLLTAISEHHEAIRQTIEAYSRYFGTYRYPVEHQLSSFQKKSALPNSPIPSLLLSIELKTGGLFGLHDSSKIVGQLVFDTASADESFSGINGKTIKCSDGEPIIRDDKGIIASIFQGPDARTAASLPQERDASWALLAFGYPSMLKTKFDQLVADATETMSVLGKPDGTWIKYDH